MKNLYRKKALDYLSSPDQLDNLMTFTSPGYWFSIVGIGVIIAAITCWGVWGKIPKEVKGTGMIVRNGGIRQIQSMGTGYLSTINVKNGDFVEKGQPLAMIVQVKTLEDIRTNRDSLSYLKREAQQLLDLEKKKKTMHIKSIQGVNNKYNDEINKITKNLNLLKKITNVYKLLAKDKAISTVTYAEHIQRLLNAEVSLMDSEVKLLNLPYEKFLADYENQSSKLSRELKIFDLMNRQNSLLQTHIKSSIVYSPISGRILSVDVRAGDNVQNGTSLMNIIETGFEQDIEVLAFMSPEQGKMVKVRMRADVSPTITKPQRYGSILGIVSDFSFYPVDEKEMMNELNNEELVKELSAKGAPYSVRIRLVPSLSNKSGYEWTSSKGPPFAIKPGTICDVNVTVEERSPISYVFPFINKFLFNI